MTLPIAAHGVRWHTTGSGTNGLLLSKAAVSGKKHFITDISVSSDAASRLAIADNGNILPLNQANAENVIGDYLKVSTTETISIDATKSYQGSNSVKVITTGVSFEGIITGSNEGANGVPALPSTEYTFSVYVWAAATKVVWCRAQQWTAAGTYIGYLANPTSITGNNDWQRISFTSTTAANCGRVIVMAATNALATTFYADAFQIEQASAVSNWAAPDNLFLLRRSAAFTFRRRFRIPLGCGSGKGAYLKIYKATSNCEANMAGFTL